MPLTIPTGFGEAAWHFTSTSGTPDFVTTCGVDLSDAGGDFAGAAEALWDYYAGSIMQETSNHVQITRCVLRVGNDGPTSAYESSHTPVGGGSAGAHGPLSMAIIARKVTNVGGRRGRGRMFMPGTAGEGTVDESGRVLEVHAALVNTKLNTLQSYMENGNANHQVVLPPVLLHSDGSTPTPIVDFAVGSLVGWIRGRIW